MSIHERFLGATNKTRYGHWEADTLVSGKRTGSAAAVSVAYERKARLVLAQKIGNLKPASHTALASISQGYLDHIVSVINRKPRKILGYRSALEVATRAGIIKQVECPILRGEDIILASIKHSGSHYVNRTFSSIQPQRHRRQNLPTMGGVGFFQS